MVNEQLHYLKRYYCCKKKKLIDFSLNLNFPYDMKSHSLFNATLGMMAHSTPRTENIGIIFHIQY